MVHGHRGVKLLKCVCLGSLGDMFFLLQLPGPVLRFRVGVRVCFSSGWHKLTWKKVYHIVWCLSRLDLPATRFLLELVFTVADFYTRHYLTNESSSAIS